MGRYWILSCACVFFISVGTTPADEPTAVDAKTLHDKVLCGYQGWFRCPNDPAKQGWRHWSRDGRKITPDKLTFEMWPDLSEFDDDEKHLAPGFTDLELTHILTRFSGVGSRWRLCRTRLAVWVYVC